MSSRLARLLFLAALWTWGAQAHALEPTAPKLVGTVIVTETQIYIAASPDGWGTTCSPTPSYVYFNRTAVHSKEMLATILAAKAAGQQIYFFGTCGSLPGYFLSNYLVVL